MKPSKIQKSWFSRCIVRIDPSKSETSPLKRRNRQKFSVADVDRWNESLHRSTKIVIATFIFSRSWRIPTRHAPVSTPGAATLKSIPGRARLVSIPRRPSPSPPRSRARGVVAGPETFGSRHLSQYVRANGTLYKRRKSGTSEQAPASTNLFFFRASHKRVFTIVSLHTKFVIICCPRVEYYVQRKSCPLLSVSLWYDFSDHDARTHHIRYPWQSNATTAS